MAQHDTHIIGNTLFEEVSMIPRNILLRNHAVAVGDVRVTSKLKSNMFLECIKAGTTSITMPSMSTSTAEGTIITDGSAQFIVRSVGPAVYHFRQPLTAYAVGDVVYSTKLPSYLRLECVVAGTTGTTEPNYASMSTGGVQS